MSLPLDVVLLPILPLRKVVVFPHMIVPLFVGRKSSKRVIETAVERDSTIFCVTQRDADKEYPKLEDLYDVGTVAKIPQIIKLPDGGYKVLVEGVSRAKLCGINDDDVCKRGLVSVYEEGDTRDSSNLAKVLITRFMAYAKNTETISSQVVFALRSITHAGRLADLVTMNLAIDEERKQEILNIVDIERRVERVITILQQEIEWMEIDDRIHKRVKKSISKDQENYFKSQKLKAIQQEMGDEELDSGIFEAEKFKEKVDKLGLEEESKEKVMAEVNRLKLMPPMSAESTVIRSYIEWVLDLPWNKKAKTNGSLEKAQKVLDEDHYGLKEIKERIVESIAVNNRVKRMRGPILCFVGPPGVGKTSLGQSIARATNRPFVRIALGGVRDESEIRGHRKTYIGAMPGRILKAMKKAKVTNPLIMLDEVDKMGSDFRGDPASALLEVLDPEQNSKFSDHYLEIDYNLSDVLFITTSNSMNIPLPLLDRMEVIRLAGYTEKEKVKIAKQYLVPKNFKNNGVKDEELEISDSVIQKIIQLYTREAGVRELDRAINKVCRKVVKQMSEKDKGKAKKVTVTTKVLSKYLGVERYKFGVKAEQDHVGKIQGLAWTAVGGELLTIEAIVYPGKGKFIYTGSLGDVMKESIQTAISIVKIEGQKYGVKTSFFEKNDIHVHVPEGATPKDGPSAGIGMTAVILSAVTGKKIKSDIALTGEVTLSGDVLAIGGLKEKLLAALRGQIREVIIPEQNKKDLAEMPTEVKKGLKIHTVKKVQEVFGLVLR
ncbi:MAG: endopeptidase La [Pseudomonadota bacterium]|nr:endopeptidase La [Pseudomonadota bacterium]